MEEEEEDAEANRYRAWLPPPPLTHWREVKCSIVLAWRLFFTGKSHRELARTENLQKAQHSLHPLRGSSWRPWHRFRRRPELDHDPEHISKCSSSKWSCTHRRMSTNVNIKGFYHRTNSGKINPPTSRISCMRRIAFISFQRAGKYKWVFSCKIELRSVAFSLNE